MDTPFRQIYYWSQDDWDPDDFYGLWRYLNRLFLNPRGVKTQEIHDLDLSRMSVDTLYLMKHLLILQGRYERYLDEYESLAPLRDVPENGREIFLDDRPTLVHPYFTEHGIYL